MISVSIVGVGRVGGALACSLPADKYKVVNLVSRKNKSAVIDTDLVFITTQDPYISEAAELIVDRISGSPKVFHTSGSRDSSVLNILKNADCRTGSIHPLVSISAPELGPERFRGAYFCVEGDDDAVKTGIEIVKDLGGNPFSVDTRFKVLYHAAAVTACGHLVALFDAAVEMMAKCGLEEVQAREILLPLVTSTVQNLNQQSTSAALTGTFARADIETFTRHLQTLNENVSDELLEIYLLLGERSLELAAKQGVSAERIDRLRTKVAVAKSKLKW